MAENKKDEILLESGTNELEIMEFAIADRYFGINVAKVVEIMQHQPVTPMPNSNPYVEGVFKPRESIVTVIDLATFMGLPASEDPEHDILIITHFNKVNTAFHVHSVEAIHRMSWADIEKPDPSIYGGEDALATGIARIDGRLVTIVDFEKILSDINPMSGIQVSDVEKLGGRPRNEHPILIAEDSPLLERLILESLNKSGYTNVSVCSNGLEAWEMLSEIKNSGADVQSKISCLITDIEMPQMDGHRLIKLIREDSAFKDLPCVIFSSLINDEMRKKGDALGASAQLSKPDIADLVRIIDGLVS
ncbi:MAG: chemotaxis protein [Defluviitaleaceae bacterium]|nr:chemotaxis protein [Defluviitaleaceae bacterium]